MKIGELKKLLEDADDEGKVIFHLGDVASPMEPHEWWRTSTLDAVFITFMPPDGWLRT